MGISKLPIIDCSKIRGSLEDVQDTEVFQKFTTELGDGMSGSGFVYFVNYEVNNSAVENMLEISRKFFALSKEIKHKYRKVDAVENFHGYSSAADEALNEVKSKESAPTPDFKESFDFYGPDAMDETKYPVEMPGFKTAADDFKASLHPLAKKIFRAFAVYLKLDDQDFFIKKHAALDNPREILSHTDFRSTYYMALGQDVEIGPESMRLGEHNDWGTITFLYQDMTGGLEARPPNDADWIPVTPIPNSIVLNAGLMLEMWSGGHFPATTHRVRLLKEKAGTLRQSLAYFIQPDGSSNCVPLVAEKENWKPMYPKVDKETHFEYFRERVRGSRAY